MKNIFTVFVLILLLSYVELSAQVGTNPTGGQPPPTNNETGSTGVTNSSTGTYNPPASGSGSTGTYNPQTGGSGSTGGGKKSSGGGSGSTGGTKNPPPPPSGRAAGPQAPPLAFEAIDTNNDGKISWTEAKAIFGHEADWGAKFSARDKNKDGVLDRSEF